MSTLNEDMASRVDLPALVSSNRNIRYEMLRLQRLLDRPVADELFISDIHGEYRKLNTLLHRGSGSAEALIQNVFPNELSSIDKTVLADLIYYPRQTYDKLSTQLKGRDYYVALLFKLLYHLRPLFSQQDLVRHFSAKHLSQISTLMSVSHRDISFLELPREPDIDVEDGGNTSLGVAVASFVRGVTASPVHVVGDIYDRGPAAERVMDLLVKYPKVDVQWGNHDVIWMAAALGHKACLANVIRVSLRYGNTETLENGYSIDLSPLAHFARRIYGDDPCESFVSKQPVQNATYNERTLFAQMHKAIAIIQFKLEGHVIKRRKEYGMADRLLLDKMDLKRGTIVVEGRVYPLLDRNFPTVNPESPYELSIEESELIEEVLAQTRLSSRLKRDIDFLFDKGSLYSVRHNSLLLHGGVALDEDGEFSELRIDGKLCSGRVLLDQLDKQLRRAHKASTDYNRSDTMLDVAWYLWCGAKSPLFCKHKMSTFERYFIADKTAHYEKKNRFFDLRDNTNSVEKILTEFGICARQGRVINGHVPVKVRRGESPIKANGKLIVIDGGFYEAYQSITGIGGFVLMAKADGMYLQSLPSDMDSRLVSKRKVESTCIERFDNPLTVGASSDGAAIRAKVEQLKHILAGIQYGS